jgi:hypothetical protein
MSLVKRKCLLKSSGLALIWFISSGVEIRYGVLGSPVPPEYLAKVGIVRIQMSSNARNVVFFIFPSL